jgi:menaquinone-dependent protoporphyrinogen oxidase
VEGQSAKIAARAADDARKAGADAEVVEARRIRRRRPPSCDAVIVVASVHRGRHGRAAERFVRAHREWLSGRRTAFLSVSISAASRRRQAQREARAMLGAFLAATGWTPDLAFPVAGALTYSKYGFFSRRLMRKRAAVEGEPTDTSRDYEFTDWPELDRQMARFLQQVAELRDGESR